ncbi:MAG: PDR/VanB family oxidoreductase [Rhizobiaceae bacterium]
MAESFDLTMVSARPLSERIREIVFRASGAARLPGWSPGAHLKFATPAGERCYSLVQMEPGDGFDEPHQYRFAVQLEEQTAGGSRHLHDLKPGDGIKVSGPHNDFALIAGASAVLVAGGIGITPILSMARALLAAGTAFEFHYACRNREVMAYRDEIQTLFTNRAHLHFDEEASSQLDLEGLLGSAEPSAHVYVCGPRGLIEAVKSAAVARGLAGSQIHFELFASPSPSTGDEAFEVVVNSTGQAFNVPPGKSIIEVLEASGLDLVYDCQRGDCGICQTGVIEGVPDHRDVVLSEGERQSGKLMQICVSRSKTPRLVLDL